MKCIILVFSISIIFEIPRINGTDALIQPDLRPPAQPVQPGNVQKFARHAVGLAGIPHNLPLKAHNRLNQLRQLPDAGNLAAADIQVRHLSAVRCRQAAAYASSDSCITNTQAAAMSSTCRNSRRGAPVPHSRTTGERDASPSPFRALRISFGIGPTRSSSHRMASQSPWAASFAK